MEIFAKGSRVLIRELDTKAEVLTSWSGECARRDAERALHPANVPPKEHDTTHHPSIIHDFRLEADAPADQEWYLLRYLQPNRREVDTWWPHSALEAAA